MVIRNPATANSEGGLFNRAEDNQENEGVTTNQSRGGLFSDTTGVGLDLSDTRGEQGPEGPEGPQGPRGPAGPIGNTGPAGADGAAGPVGPEGPQGPQGNQGPQGDTGPEGPAGPIGPTGPQGPIGNTGPTGPAGTDGVSVTAVTVVESGTQNDPDGTVYDVAVSLSNGTTQDAGSFTADRGPVGPRGPAGTGGTTDLAAGTNITITQDPNNPNMFTIAAPDARDATSIRGAHIVNPPTSTGTYVLEYDEVNDNITFQEIDDLITVDTALSTTSTNPVENRVVTAGINTKQDTLTFDTTPTAGNTDHVVSSDALVTLFDNKADAPDQSLTSTDYSQVRHQSDRSLDTLVTADNIADVFDVTVLDTDVIRNANDEITGIRIGGTYLDPSDPGTAFDIADTTYTFTNGTGGSFTVTPSNGSPQVITTGASSAGTNIPSGIAFPTVTEAGDFFFLQIAVGNNLPGLYERNAANDAWIAGNTDTDTTYTEGNGIDITNDMVSVDANTSQFQFDNTSGEMSLINPFDPDRAIADWDSGTTYSENDIVLYVDEGMTPSFYRSRTNNNTNNEPVDSSGDQDFTNWRLINAGLVAVQGPDDNTGVGVTANSTLRFEEGNGVVISRSGTSFTVGVRATGHGDASIFGPGFRYSFYALYGETGLQTGVINNILDGIIIDSVTHESNGRIRLDLDGSGTADTFAAGEDGAFAVQDGTDELTRLFPNLPSGDTDGRIVYFFADVNDPANSLHIIQTDPIVGTVAALAAEMGIPNPGDSRSFSASVDAYHFNPDHNIQQYEPAVWAREGNTDTVPGDKLESLSMTRPPGWADGNASEPIDPSWLQSLVGATSTQDGTSGIPRAPQAGEEGEFLRGDGTWADIAINDLSDVEFTRPTDQSTTGAIQGVRWDGSNSEWINIDLPAMNASGRLDFTMRDADTYDVTGFITDPTDPTSISPVRSAEFSNNNLLRFNLATFSTTTALSATTALNWDVPAGDLRASATLDPLVESIWVADIEGSVTAGTGSATFAQLRGTSSQTLPITTRAALNTTLDVSTTNPIYDLGNPSTASVTANFLDNNGARQGNTRTVQYSWRTPTVGLTVQNLGNRNFLTTASSATYNITIGNVNDRSIAASGVAGVQGSVTNTSVTGNASGTLTFTNVLHKSNAGTARSVTVNTTFTRPAGVQSAAGGQTHAGGTTGGLTRSASINFVYPAFWILIEGNTLPTRADLIAGNAFDSSLTVAPSNTSNGNASNVFGSNGLLTVDNSAGNAATLWVGIRTAAGIQPNMFLSGSSATRFPLSPQPTAQVVSLAPDNAATLTGYTAEDYNLFGIPIGAGQSPVIEITT